MTKILKNVFLNSEMAFSEPSPSYQIPRNPLAQDIFFSGRHKRKTSRLKLWTVRGLLGLTASVFVPSAAWAGWLPVPQAVDLRSPVDSPSLRHELENAPQHHKIQYEISAKNEAETQKLEQTIPILDEMIDRFVALNPQLRTLLEGSPQGLKIKLLNVDSLATKKNELILATTASGKGGMIVGWDAFSKNLPETLRGPWPSKQQAVITLAMGHFDLGELKGWQQQSRERNMSPATHNRQLDSKAFGPQFLNVVLWHELMHVIDGTDVYEGKVYRTMFDGELPGMRMEKKVFQKERERILSSILDGTLSLTDPVLANDISGRLFSDSEFLAYIAMLFLENPKNFQKVSQPFYEYFSKFFEIDDPESLNIVQVKFPAADRVKNKKMDPLEDAEMFDSNADIQWSAVIAGSSLIGFVLWRKQKKIKNALREMRASEA